MPRATALAVAAMAAFWPAADAQASPLDRYARNARLFLVFADRADDAGLTAQKADIAANIDGYEDRDLIVFIFSRGRLASTEPPQEVDLDGDALRARLSLPSNGFAAALIGLDAGVKLRSAEPIDACALFREIDGMPMRRRDIQSKGYAVPCRPVAGR